MLLLVEGKKAHSEEPTCILPLLSVLNDNDVQACPI